MDYTFKKDTGYLYENIQLRIKNTLRERVLSDSRDEHRTSNIEHPTSNIEIYPDEGI